MYRFNNSHLLTFDLEPLTLNCRIKTEKPEEKKKEACFIKLSSVAADFSPHPL